MGHHYTKNGIKEANESEIAYQNIMSQLLCLCVINHQKATHHNKNNLCVLLQAN
jgi:hypothetical protein